VLALVAGVVIGVFTVGIGFVIVVIAYAVVAHVTAPKVLLRVKGEQGSVTPMVTD
jgi:archaellin